MKPTPKLARLDAWLTEHGLAESRTKAQALVMAGRVTVNGLPARKPGASVRAPARVEVAPGRERVGRGALKLEGALDAFGLSPQGRVVMDVGASTGGFTEVLLRRGALRVYAVDAGRGQLHEGLRGDPRVVVLERTNARYLSAAAIKERCGMAVMDVSFISVRKVLPALRPLLAPEADVVVLVKPQFEVGRRQVGRGGVVRDPALHAQALLAVARAAEAELGYAIAAACPSPLKGAAGNQEFFLHLRREGPPLAEPVLRAIVDQAVSAC